MKRPIPNVENLLVRIIPLVKTPLGLLTCIVVFLDASMGMIAYFAKIPDQSRTYLLYFAFIILLAIVVFAGLALLLQFKKENTPVTASVKRVEDLVNWSVNMETRASAYAALRSTAKNRIRIFGIGMTNLSTHELGSLMEQARKVCIDILMMDPQYLRNEPQFTKELETCFDITDFVEKVERACGKLQEMCRRWNKDPKNPYKFRMSVYSHLPTLSMVIVDPDHDGTMIGEKFLYKSNGRPRFTLDYKKSPEVFSAFHAEYESVWGSARVVVS